MKVIYKYTLNIVDEQVIEIPEGGNILSVQSQHQYPQIWVLCDPEAVKVKRKFRVVGTGMPFVKEDGNFLFIGTVQIAPLVWHVFEEV